MKLLIYLRFLRPIRSLLWTAGTVWWSWTWLMAGFGPDDIITTKIITLGTALPLILGFCIAGAALEPMHRPFALLLPNIRRRQRTAAGVSMLIAALAVTFCTAWAVPTLSPWATFGLICAMITLPCLASRGEFFWILGWMALSAIGGTPLTQALASTPWLFFFGGLAICGLCLVHVFSRTSLRRRASTFFLSIQSSLLVLHYKGERALRQADRQADALARQNRSAPADKTLGRNWPTRSVGDDTWSWMQVFLHAVYGRNQRWAYLKSQGFFVSGISIFAIVPILLKLIEHRGAFKIADFGLALANLIAPEAGHSVAFPFIIQAGFCALISLAVPPPSLVYPISRRRLGDVVFGLSIIQLGFVMVLPPLALLLPSIIGQILSGHFLPELGLPLLITFNIGLFPLLPLIACAGSARTPARRILLGVPVAAAILAITITHQIWSQWIFTAPGIAVVVMATTGSLFLLRWRIRRRYDTCDLFQEMGSDSLSGGHVARQN